MADEGSKIGDAEVESEVSPAESRQATGSIAGAVLLTTAAAAALQGCSRAPGTAGPNTNGAAPSSTPTVLQVTPASWSAPTDAPYARFLQQAQFSSTETEIADVKKKGFAGWLDEQMALPSSQGGWDWLYSRGYGVIDERNLAQQENGPVDYMIWNQLIRSPDQVRRRVAIALTEYFVINTANMTEPWFKPFHVARFFDILCNNAFSNFRKLLEEVTLSVAMGAFLNALRNEKEDPNTGRLPDENYAREVMQLFTIGVSQLNLDGTPKLDAQGNPIDSYNQSDVTNLARVFTGYDTDITDGFTKSPVPPFFFTIPNVGYTRNPMKFYSFRHSMLEKKFLGTTIPANTDGPESMRIALDTLFNHPNVGPFFARQMIQRLVTSNPSGAYVQRIATVFNNNGSGVRGDLKAVFRAILLDDEARNLANMSVPLFGKLREPMLRFAQWGRTFKLTSTAGTWKISPPNWTYQSIVQPPLQAPSVFNFFRPGYVPPNTRFAAEKATVPEFQIVNETTVSQYINLIRWVATDGLWTHLPDRIDDGFFPQDYGPDSSKYDIQADYSAEYALLADPQTLVRKLNLVMAAGRMTEQTETTIVNMIKSLNPDNNNRKYVMGIVITAVMCCNEYLVQK